MSTSWSTYFVSVSSTNINKAQRGKSYMAVRFQINDHKKLQLLWKKWSLMNCQHHARAWDIDKWSILSTWKTTLMSKKIGFVSIQHR